MPLGAPALQVARGVLELPYAGARTPDQDERFIQAVRDEFPTITSRQLLPIGLPAGIPYLALQSTASRLAISGMGSELETRFYGDYAEDVERSLAYFSNKLQAVLRGWAAVDATPSFLGVVLTMNFAFEDDDGSPAAFIAGHHLSADLPADLLQDTLVRVSIRAGDTHFVTLSVSNFETRTYSRPVFPGQQVLQVRPWEGTVDACGIELTIDINNKLALRNRQGDFAIDEEAAATMMEMLKRVTEAAPATFVENATIDLAALVPGA